MSTVGLTASAGTVSLALPEQGWTLSQPTASGFGLSVAGVTPAGSTLRLTSGILQANSASFGGLAGTLGRVELQNTSQLRSLGLLSVGGAGEGQIALSGGAGLVSVGALLAQSQGGEGSVSLTGANTSWNNTGFRVDIGSWGPGQVNLAQGAQFFNAAETTLGYVEGSTGEVLASGAGTSFRSAGLLTVGRLGVGNLELSAGAVGAAFNGLVVGAAVEGSMKLTGSPFTAQGVAVPNTSASTVLGEVPGGVGSLDLMDGATFTSANQVQVGREGDGRLTIAEGSHFTSAKAGSSTGTSSILGRGRENELARGEVLVTGAGSSWQQDGDTWIGLVGSGYLTLSEALRPRRKAPS